MGETKKYLESKETPKNKMKELSGIRITNLGDGSFDVHLIGQRNQEATITINQASLINKRKQSEVVKLLVKEGVDLKNFKSLIKLSMSGIPIFEAIALKQAINLKYMKICWLLFYLATSQKIKKLAGKVHLKWLKKARKENFKRAIELKKRGYKEQDFIL
jgi:hypothetical protein